jgi:hypothetical protein
MVLGERYPLISRGRQVAEITVVLLGLIESGVVHGITAKESVCRRESLVHTNLPVILPDTVMVAVDLSGRIAEHRVEH